MDEAYLHLLADREYLARESVRAHRGWAKICLAARAVAFAFEPPGSVRSFTMEEGEALKRLREAMPPTPIPPPIPVVPGGRVTWDEILRDEIRAWEGRHSGEVVRASASTAAEVDDVRSRFDADTHAFPSVARPAESAVPPTGICDDPGPGHKDGHPEKEDCTNWRPDEWAYDPAASAEIQRLKQALSMAEANVIAEEENARTAERRSLEACTLGAHGKHQGCAVRQMAEAAVADRADGSLMVAVAELAVDGIDRRPPLTPMPSDGTPPGGSVTIPDLAALLEENRLLRARVQALAAALNLTELAARERLDAKSSTKGEVRAALTYSVARLAEMRTALLSEEA